MVATAPTARGQRTRASLLAATAELVAARGFHAVGISDIGAAAGVSGAAIYRHFASKDALLVAVFESVVGDLLEGARRAVEAHATAEATLCAFIDAHIQFALANRTVIKVYDQEAHNLPAADRARVRRQQRSYANLWFRTVGEVNPTWTEADTAASVHGVFGLINSVADYRIKDAAGHHADRLRTIAEGAFDLRRR